MPSYLRAKQIKLEKQAYDIRRNDKTIRTRVFLKGTEIVLKTKGKEDNMFKEYEESSDEDGEYEDAADSQPTPAESASMKAARGKKSKAQPAAAANGRGGRGGGKLRSSPNGILVQQHFGFRNGRSTEQAIMNFMQNMERKKENKYHLATFVDSRKAFCSISHRILFAKLEKMGVRNVELVWFKDYITKRKQ